MNDYIINTVLPVSYKVRHSKDIFNLDNLDLLYSDSIEKSNRRLIVLDENLNEFYGKFIHDYFNHHNIQYKLVLLKSGESSKSESNLLLLLEEIENFNINRRSEPIISIGGGTVLDITGLAASLYRRGVPYIRVPTTLLGIVDVSVAAKTAVNFQHRRNRLGTYYPPVLSLIDKSFIQTQNLSEISSGMGEILKLAVIKDAKLFSFLEKYGKDLLISKFNHEMADEVIHLSIKGMIEELENNLWEKNLQRLVDFGHTFSPIIEMRTLKTSNALSHGQAVTLDVIFSSIVSCNRNLLSYEGLMRIVDIVKNIQLPIYHEYFCDFSFLIESLNDTMKHRNGNQYLPIPLEIGKGDFINNLKETEIYKAIEVFKKI